MSWPSRANRIAIVGPSGSGKSTQLHVMAELMGCAVLDAQVEQATRLEPEVLYGLVADEDRVGFRSEDRHERRSETSRWT